MSYPNVQQQRWLCSQSWKPQAGFSKSHKRFIDNLYVIRYTSIKWCAFAETISITVLLCHYKRSSRRHKPSSGRSVSKAAPRCGNMCINPVLFRRSLPLQKKPSDLRKPSDLQRIIHSLHIILLYSLEDTYRRVVKRVELTYVGTWAVKRVFSRRGDIIRRLWKLDILPIGLPLRATKKYLV